PRGKKISISRIASDRLGWVRIGSGRFIGLVVAEQLIYFLQSLSADREVGGIHELLFGLGLSLLLFQAVAFAEQRAGAEPGNGLQEPNVNLGFILQCGEKAGCAAAAE